MTNKLDNRLEKQNTILKNSFEELEDKLKTSKPTITGKEVKIDKNIYDTLNKFMKTSKQVLNDIPKNQALFHELTDYTKNYRELEYQKRNVEVEVRKLEIKNEELKRENNRLKTMLKIVVQSIKQFFHKILNIGTERDKDSVVREIKEYYEVDLYNKKDLHDIADNTSKEKEINDYLYIKNHEYGKDFYIKKTSYSSCYKTIIPF